MRLKQTLGVLLSLLILSALAAAAGSQLTNIRVAGQGSETTVILHASGAFNHTEYRPTDNLLLVDLSGVAAGKLKDSAQTVNRPGLASYHVVDYTGASGAPVTRVEMALTAGAVVTVSESHGDLTVRIAGSKEASAAPAPAATPAQAAPMVESKAEAPAPHARAQAASAKPVVVRNVSVVRGHNGTTEVEITANGRIAPTAMKLSAPDRIVLDLPNAVLAGKPRPVPVNGTQIKEVRLGRYQLNPPVTRVVVDLNSPLDYEVVPSANKVVLKLHTAAPAVAAAPAAQPAQQVPAAAPAPAAVTATPVASAAKLATEAKQEPAKDYVFVEPSYQPKPPAPDIGSQAAAVAAAHVVEASTAAQNSALLPPVSASLNGPAANLAAEQQQAAQRPAAAATQRYTGEPISVNLKDVDLKDFFRLIHEISGLNIVLDPSVRGSLTLVLDDVPWDQALDIVLQNNGLERRLDGNVLRIASTDTFRKEADDKRAAAEAQALAVDRVQLTHFLSYAHAAEVMPIVKSFLTTRGQVIADPRTNALIIQDIPSVLPQVQRVLAQLDRKTQEVEIEARVVAATRNFAREIGMQLGFGWGNTPTAVGGVGNVGTSPLSVSVPNPKYFVLGNNIPLFSNQPATGPTSGISFSNATSNYRVDAILTMAESKGLLKILSRPRVVTQNNIGALVKQGVRIPVVTAAQLGGPPTTTYVEAALRLQVTPQITAENTIFMNIDVENTTPDFSRAVGGNPTLITQQATTSVLVTDGGTAVIGGVIQTQNSVNVFQVPLLGDIPIFGNLFKHRSISTATQELIFFITPRIVQT